MEKTTLTTYGTFNASLHLCAVDCELVINDYSSGETLSIEGISRNTLNRALQLYMQNLSLQKDEDGSHLRWFQEMLDTAKDCISKTMYEST